MEYVAPPVCAHAAVLARGHVTREIRRHAQLLGERRRGRKLYQLPREESAGVLEAAPARWVEMVHVLDGTHAQRAAAAG